VAEYLQREHPEAQASITTVLLRLAALTRCARRDATQLASMPMEAIADGRDSIADAHG